MTTYLLPPELGGIEVREVGKRGDGRLILVPTAVELAELDMEFCIDENLLTSANPPLPEEPDVRAVELAGRVWTREGWPGEHHWESKGYHGASWLALNQLAQGVPIVPLVPDPTASAPWQNGHRGVEVNGFPDGVVRLVVAEAAYADLAADEAECLGAELIRRAREVRKAEGGAA